MRILLVALIFAGSPLAQTPLPDQAVYFTKPGAHPTPADADLGARMAGAIAAAKNTVEFAMLRLDLPVVVDALIKAKENGIRVRVLTDDDIRAARFAGPYGRLQRSGVPVRVDRAFPWGANLHHKFCVIDETWVWGGDWNASVGDSTRSEHSAFLVKAPGLARQFTAQFNRMWRSERAGPGSPAARGGDETAVAGGGAARAHFASAQDLGVVVANEIVKAKRSVDVGHTFFSHRRVLMAVLEVARRGVRVRVGSSFVEGRTRVRDACARFGIPFSEGLGTKVIIIDGTRVVTGSWNATDGVDHENVVVFEGCPKLSATYRRRLAASLVRGRAPYFLPPEAHGNRPSDRERDARIALLSRTGSTKLEEPQDIQQFDRMRRPTATMDHGIPVVPTGVSSRSSEGLARHRRIAIEFERAKVAPVRTRFVLSTTRLHDSFGPHLDRRHRPVVLDAPAIRGIDAPFILEWDVSLPEAGLWRVELDAFVGEGEGWRWTSNWRLPPAAWACAPEVTVDRGRPGTTVKKLPVQPGSVINVASLSIDPRVAGTLEIEATARGGDGLRFTWSHDGKIWDQAATYDLPLLLDGRRHTYVIDLVAVDGWASLDAVRAVRLSRGDLTRAPEVHGWRLGTSRRLGPVADGTFRTAAGKPRTLLTVAGSDVAGRRWVRAGRPVEIKVASPDPHGRPTPFLLLVKRGWPAADEAFDLAPFKVPGSLCFRPHLVVPPGDRVMGVADSTGLDRTAFARPGPAPVSFEVPLGMVESGDTLVLQAVFVGESSGVSNAVVLRVR